MIKDLREFAPDSEIEADLCVVGAGAAGIALAREFEGSDVQVVLLESGGFSHENNTHALSEGESVGLKHTGLTDGRGRLLGGTTRLWAGQCMPLDEIDFEKRPWVPYSGWPLRKAELDPYYERAMPVFRLGQEVYDERIWRRFGVDPPALNRDKLSAKFSIYSPQPDFAKAYRKELHSSRNVLTVLHANVTSIRTNEAASVVRYINIRTLEGRQGRVKAKAFVLCSGGVENARLLLLSKEDEPHGLGNRYDLVGRFFQEHPNAFSGVVCTDNPKMLQDIFNVFYNKGVRYFAKMSLGAQFQEREQVLNSNAHMVYHYDADSAAEAAREVYRAVRRGRLPANFRHNVQRMIADFNQTFSIVARRYLQGKPPVTTPNLIYLQTYTEQAPNPHSRVTLSSKQDALGLNRACIDWRLTDLEKRTFEVITKTVADEFTRLGLAQVSFANWLDEGRDDWATHVVDCYHHIGTTRMADDPKVGVVNRDCRVHGIENLFVSGSSVFPTSGYANPTLTIVALALRLADHLKTSVLAERVRQ